MRCAPVPFQLAEWNVGEFTPLPEMVSQRHVLHLGLATMEAQVAEHRELVPGDVVLWMMLQVFIVDGLNIGPDLGQRQILVLILPGMQAIRQCASATRSVIPVCAVLGVPARRPNASISSEVPCHLGSSQSSLVKQAFRASPFAFMARSNHNSIVARSPRSICRYPSGGRPHRRSRDGASTPPRMLSLRPLAVHRANGSRRPAQRGRRHRVRASQP